MIQSNARILIDSSGNPVTVVTDGGVYRLSGVSKVLDSSGSQINPSKEETLTAIKDTAGIKKITDALPAGTNYIGKFQIGNGTYEVALLSDGTYYQLRTGTKLYGSNDVIITAADATTIPANTHGIIAMAQDDADGKSYYLHRDGAGALKVTAAPPQPPSNTTPFTLYDVGEVGPNPAYLDTVSSVIGNGLKLYLQSITSSAEGDPSEKGSVVRVYWRVGSPAVDHLVEMGHLMGQPWQFVLPNTHYALDGTEMTGNGSNTYVVLRRERMSTSAQEIYAVIRGYIS